MADERFKQEDAGSYDSAAASFHRLSSVYSAPFADELVRLAGVGRGDQALDLGAGTGIVSDRVNATGARCIAADLSDGMLRVAVQRFPAVRMDAEAFAIRRESFDAVIALFAIMHFPHPAGVLRACRDSLRPGGVLTFAYGAPAPWPTAVLRLPRYAADQVSTRTGRLLAAPQALHERLPHEEREQETRLARSGRRATAQLVSLTRKAGFADLQTGWIGRRFEIPSAEDFWELQAIFSSRARKTLDGMEQRSRERLQAEFLAESQAVLDRGGSLIYPVGAGWVRATKPLE